MPPLLQLALLIFVVIIGLLLTVDLNSGMQGQIKVRLWALPIAVALLFTTFAVEASAGQVGASERGIVLRLGAATDSDGVPYGILPPGLYFVIPFIESVERMDIRTHAYEAPASAASKDLQEVSTTVTINYRVDPLKVTTVYVDLRRDYVNVVLKPFVQEAVKSVTAEYNAGDLITLRPKVRSQIEESLKTRVGQYGVIVDNVSITDFSFSKVFTDAIEAKVGAAQDAERAKNKLLQIEVEAQQAKAQAGGARDAAIARAEGEAQAILRVAQAQAEANKLVAETLTREIILYAYVQKLADGTKVIILPNGQQFILPADLVSDTAK
jgi:regulator of protease activity HflC (stomatin/prohibitin superfamily)